MYRAIRARGARALAALLLALAVAGCGVTTTSGTAGTAKATTRPTATATTRVFPTVTPTPLPTGAPGPCGLAPRFDPTAQPLLLMGDMLVESTFGLAYPSRKLPDNTPLAPFKLAATSGPELDQQLPIDPLTNPYLNEPGGGFMVTVCNTSKTTAHTLQSVSIRLDSFMPYTGQLNEWNACDGIYTPPSPGGGGCGGAIGGDGIAFLHATLTTPTVGMTAVATPSSSSAGDLLPISLKPNQSEGVNLGLTPPTAAGTYTFSYALTVDGAQTQFTQVMGPILLAPVAHKWGGQACTGAAMLRQIPTTNPPASYICPEA